MFASNIVLVAFFGLIILPSSEQTENDKPLSKGEINFLISMNKAAFGEALTYVRDPNTPKNHLDKETLQRIANLGMCTIDDMGAIMAKSDKNGDGFWSLEDYVNFATSFEIPTEGTSAIIACKEPNDQSGGVTTHHESTIMYGLVFSSIDKLDGQIDGFFTKENLAKHLKTKTIKHEGVTPKADFKTMDSDGNGKVVRKEFFDFATKNVVKLKKQMAEVKNEAKFIVKQNKEKE